jgi:predicted nuclease with TOPRIM domain
MSGDQSKDSNAITQTEVNDQVELDVNGEPVRGPVDYKSYSKVVGVNKKLQSQVKDIQQKLEAFEQKERELEEKRLSEQGEYKKLLELERKKRLEEEQKRTQYQKDLLDAHKLNAIKERLPGKITRPEYYSFIDTDKIAIDPETGIIDEASIIEAVNQFVETHGRLLERQGSPGLPQNAAKDGTSINFDQWKNLPLKEKKARMKDVFNNYNRSK